MKDHISGAEISYDPKLGNWVLCLGEEVIELDGQPSDALLSLLPFTQRSTQEILELIGTYATRDPSLNEGELKAKFPWPSFLFVAFRQGSPHWVFKSLNWIHELGDNLSEDLNCQLKAVVDNKKKYDQKTRQLAYKLLSRRQIERTQPRKI